MARLPRRVWDSAAFLGWLQFEADKQAACRPVIRAAEKGELTIVCSSLALVEVLTMRGETPIPKENAEKVEAFFGQPYIVVRNLDRRTAELARTIVWESKVKAKDAAHVATALLAGVDVLETFDGQLINRSPIKCEDFVPLEVREPTNPQTQISLLDEE
jgi:predicted nucleic acid-binding protein